MRSDKDWSTDAKYETDETSLQQEYLETRMEHTRPSLNFGTFDATKVAGNVGNQVVSVCVTHDLSVEYTRLLEVN
jgi:hypothetical protein